MKQEHSTGMNYGKLIYQHIKKKKKNTQTARVQYLQEFILLPLYK